MSRSVISIILLISTLALLVAVPADAIMLVTRDDEVRIGKQVEAQVISEYGGLSKDASLNERVARIGKAVAAMSTRKDITYTYKVLNSDIVNAFAAPGGPVLITKKLAGMLSTDDELAFVLAHETGHIAAQHGRKAINNAMIAQGVFSLLFRKSSDSVRQGMAIMYTLYDRGYSREQEYEADSYGVDLAAKSGFNTEGSVKALAKLGMKRARGIDKYLSTHPDVPDRIDRAAKISGIDQQRKQELIKEAQSDPAAK